MAGLDPAIHALFFHRGGRRVWKGNGADARNEPEHDAERDSVFSVFSVVNLCRLC
jgi:hypothetical protein